VGDFPTAVFRFHPITDATMDSIITEFLIESHENLDRLERDLVELEKNPTEKETLASIFRTIHTLKGSSGFLGFEKLEAIAHSGENLLSKMRDGLLVINPDIAGALLATVDAVRTMLREIEATGAPEDRDYSTLISLLVRLNEGETGGGGVAAEVAPAAPEVVEVAVAASSPVVVSTPVVVAAPVPPPAVAPVVAAPAPAPVAAPPVASAPAAAVPAAAPAKATVSAPAPAAAPKPSSGSSESGDHKPSSAADTSIRVDVGLLDKLVNLVGELVLARNQILQFTNQNNDSAFLATSQRLNLITTELQGSVMKTRMQPIGNIWSKLPRVVRDLSTSCGKLVRLEMEGKETELDKTIIEAIKDPLTHIVRNSVDHGIEMPEVREEKGKTPEGCLRMRAYHEGGQVNIEITDDGGGIHLEKVKQKAVSKGLITNEQAARMTDHQASQLIFMPGFSTAEKVTNVSGRGVGMDVVKTNIEKIGGTVDLQSQFGAGTTLKIKIPLTLAIIPALIVTSGSERFAIPQVSLLELVRLEAGEAKDQIEYIHGTPVYRLRGKILPLVSLNRSLKLKEMEEGRVSKDDEEVHIVVLQADGHPFGLVVDEINDTQEIVVKPLGKQLKGLSCFAGATIMGDGHVALILDVLGLAQQSNVVNETKGAAVMESGSDGRKGEEQKQTLLLFAAGSSGRMAIPLSIVARLEEFPRSMVEHSAGKPVIRYRGQILPLVQVSNYLAPGEQISGAIGDSMQVVVYTENGRSVGLVVEKIDDIVSETITVKRHAYGNGILGSVVIQDQVTDLLDVKSVIRAADPSILPDKTPSTPAA
jgi:two-component system chemotaxis sensor kinase CheA